MATLIPSIEQIQKFKVPPTEGELALLTFMDRVLDETYEVYFNPYLNGDRPDVLVMRRGNGVIVFEVKDWNLNNFSIDERKKWRYIPNNSVVKSPLDQVLKYKDNLFNLHVDTLLEEKINNIKKFNIVSCAVYFHCASQSTIENLIIKPFQGDEKYQKWLYYNMNLIGRDGLNEQEFSRLMRKCYLLPQQQSLYFTPELYTNFKRLLSPTRHLITQGERYSYTRKQQEIIYSTKLEQRIKGVFGSGKTTVLAARAVQAYKRALARNDNPRVLILTYNITLKNFIHDKMMRVEEDFPWENFIIINYHQFINAELNNLNVEFEIPSGLDTEELSKYLESHYYGNIQLFEDHKDEIVKYDAVLIDEIQDYHRAWMEIIKGYFRDPQGDYVLFGDVKQNIYGQPTRQKDVVTNVLGVNELKYCFRSGLKVLDLVETFQTQIFGDKYDIDSFEENKGVGALPFQKEGYINYMYLQGENPVVSLYNIIRGNILNRVADTAPNDITILGYTTRLLRTFDAYYRYASREKANSMLETIEAMYLTHLNYIGMNNKENPNYGWFENISKHLKKKIFPNRQKMWDNDVIKLRQHIAKLFTIYDLYTEFSSTFKKRLEEECKECLIPIEAFMAFREHYADILKSFKGEVYHGDYKFIRDNKKLHFWMNSGTIKISTINSFKGWESEVVFLILEPKYESSTSFNISFDELLYTGITRTIRNLVIINFGNEEYDKKVRPIINGLKNRDIRIGH